METLKRLLQKVKAGRVVRLTLQFTHFLIALGMLITAIVEFSAERPLFDLLGSYADLPKEVEVLFFQVRAVFSRSNYTLKHELANLYTYTEPGRLGWPGTADSRNLRM